MSLEGTGGRLEVIDHLATEKATAVSVLCRVFDVSGSGYYKWRNRRQAAPTQREVADAEVIEKITEIHQRSRCTYGVRRVHRQLRRLGVDINRKRVARLMSAAGLAGRCVRRRCPRTTIADPTAKAPPDLVRRNFNPVAPDVTWVGDITYVETAQGWLYLATVYDLYSRRIIGWSMADHMRTELASDALRNALDTKGGHVNGVIFHSDRGSQYTSGEFADLCKNNGITRSVGAVGVCWDNAAAESLNATLKKECIHLYQFQTRQEAKLHIFEYIETWYNKNRLHSSLDYLTPIEVEDYFRSKPNE